MMEKIIYNERIFAIILFDNYESKGIKFFTPDEFAQQLGYMSHPTGHIITPHIHNLVPREVCYTKEVLIIKSGKIRVDFYDDDKKYLESRILNAGDVILLAYGGHGIEILEAAEIIEVKQGPYVGEEDKTRFAPVDLANITIKGLK